MSERLVIKSLQISDVPPECRDDITVAGTDVQLVTQPTGFGCRRYFLCPACNRKCGKLYGVHGYIYCQKCIPLDIYRIRRGLYDEAGAALIVWHMRKLAKNISDKPIKYPFRYFDYPSFPPRYMRSEKYRKILLKLQILENMRFAANFYGARFTAADIRKYTNDKFIRLFELWQVADFQIFATEIPPEYYSFILGEDTAARLCKPWHIGPIRLKFGGAGETTAE